MTTGQPQQSTASDAPAPAAVDSPTNWVAEASDQKDRWALKLPGNVLKDRYAEEYRAKHGKLPTIPGWTVPEPPTYVRVTATRRSAKPKSSVLKTHVTPGSELKFANVARAAFGKDVTRISFTAANVWQFRLAKLRTPAALLKIAAVVLGAASAAITAILIIIEPAPQPGHTLSGADLAWGVAAACLAFIAPFLALASSSLFS